MVVMVGALSEDLVKLTLLVTPDGKCLLSGESIKPEDAAIIRREFARWSIHHPLIVSGAEVVKVSEIDLDLDSAKRKPRAK